MSESEEPVENGLSARLERGFAVISGQGRLVTGKVPPAAVSGRCEILGRLPLVAGAWRNWLRRVLMPDRYRLRLCELEGGRLWLADAEQPFVTWLDGVPELSLQVVSERILACPWTGRTGARLWRLIPGSLREALCVTEFASGWCVVATASRVVTVEVPAGETLEVDRSALVAWRGEPGGRVTGVCRRLRLRDVLVPRAPAALRVSLEGPCQVWVQGVARNRKVRRATRGCGS